MRLQHLFQISSPSPNALSLYIKPSIEKTSPSKPATLFPSSSASASSTSTSSSSNIHSHDHSHDRDIQQQPNASTNNATPTSPQTQLEKQVFHHHAISGSHLSDTSHSFFRSTGSISETTTVTAPSHTAGIVHKTNGGNESDVRKILVGDSSGCVYCFEVGSLDDRCDKVAWTANLDKPIGAIDASIRDRIVVASGSNIHFFNEKGHVFNSFETTLTESITDVRVHGPSGSVFVTGEYSLNRYVNGKEVDFFLCPDKINNMIFTSVLDERALPIIAMACQDKKIRIIKGSTEMQAYPLDSTPIRLAVIASTPTSCDMLITTTSSKIHTLTFTLDPPNLTPAWTHELPTTTFAFSLSPSQSFFLYSHKQGVGLGYVNQVEKRLDLWEDIHVEEDVVGLVVWDGCGVVVLRSGRVLKVVKGRGDATRQSGTSNEGLDGSMKMESSLTFDERNGDGYLLSVYGNCEIDMIALYGDFTLDLKDDESSVRGDKPLGIVSVMDKLENQEANKFSAGYRCMESTKRVNLMVYPTEGKYGTLAGYVMTKTHPPQCQSIKHMIKPFSLHDRVHRIDESIRFNNQLLLTGELSLSELHYWIWYCFPGVPERLPDGDTVSYSFKCVSKGSHVTCNISRGHLQCQTDTLSTLSLLKSTLTQIATERHQIINISLKVDSESVQNSLKALYHCVDEYIQVARDVMLCDAMIEVEAAQGVRRDGGVDEVGIWEDSFSVLLGDAAVLKKRFLELELRLDRVFKFICELYVCSFAFKGIDVKQHVPRLLQVLQEGTKAAKLNGMTHLEFSVIHEMFMEKNG